ncbi:Enoyl-CoA hydratase [Mortierella claussenii]|nr:Enoyl-CoA hydratase [Mortierella claussenii]
MSAIPDTSAPTPASFDTQSILSSESATLEPSMTKDQVLAIGHYLSRSNARLRRLSLNEQFRDLQDAIKEFLQLACCSELELLDYKAGGSSFAQIMLSTSSDSAISSTHLSQAHINSNAPFCKSLKILKLGYNSDAPQGPSDIAVFNALLKQMPQLEEFSMAQSLDDLSLFEGLYTRSLRKVSIAMNSECGLEQEDVKKQIREILSQEGNNTVEVEVDIDERASSYYLNLSRNRHFQAFIRRFGGEHTIATSKKEMTRDDPEQLVLVKKRGTATVITINRPHKRNCVNGPTAKRLYQAFLDFDADPTAAVAILTGAGGNFCAGADLAAIQNQDEANPMSSEWPEDTLPGPIGPMGPTRMTLSKPVIAAISGFAVAGGLELALWCDIRIVDATATLGVFCRLRGVPLIDGGTVRLPQVVGRGVAMDLMLTGRAIKAAEALKIHLATCYPPSFDETVSNTPALEQALALASVLAAHPQTCMRNDRLSSHASQPIREAMLKEFSLGIDTLSSGEFMQAIGQFFEQKDNKKREKEEEEETSKEKGKGKARL